MSINREEAARLALEAANQLWGYPTADDELVILHELADESAWAFTYNTHTYAQTRDVMRALAAGNGPIVVAKESGEVYPMPSAYSCSEALRIWQKERGDR